MNFHYDDDCSSPEPSIPEDMTEEKAMEIWLRRDSELEEERLQRVRQQRELELQQQPPMGELAQQQQQYRGPSSPSSSGSSSSHGQPPAIPAARRSSAAWDAAVSQNAMGAYDPAYHDAYMAYQRFINMNRPGMADAYVPSTPGLARLIEQQREEDRLYEEQQRQELAAAQQREAQQRQALEAHQRRNAAQQGYHGSYSSHNTMGGSPLPQDVMFRRPQDAGLEAQVREYERLSQVHSAQNNSQQDNYSRPPTVIATTTIGSSASTNDNDSTKKKEHNVNSYYLATPNPTQYLTKPVICYHCRADMYTHHLAKNYMCQQCCQISAVAREQDLGSGWEEKRADKEDGEQEVNMSDFY
mmetsp:Transcript_13204/g.24279  ORF Transcript_13204/g.24279 Transcript_13204/m.24279 type:complete len:356 (+) Transcript_13204:223-1290(+)|eukprot:CAMPEP_0201936768 /NCGR_PEP_ID=MMETSP0903-20130614/38088_1 /ASSEMBLY_ACC=CAM_ASM_000552 /TAXON_ID=420261 /ORGANISM="Thalassiosira antarctica, Strain CCMP982" /LENGTH=355 /DNA_ID=CAMNT_0048477533 /DNA_START=149 /DNA_END=1216 /DNA_ORIENTATION=+